MDPCGRLSLHRISTYKHYNVTQCGQINVQMDYFPRSSDVMHATLHVNGWYAAIFVLVVSVYTLFVVLHHADTGKRGSRRNQKTHYADKVHAQARVCR